MVSKPTGQVEEEKEAERVRSGRQRVSSTVQLSVAVQFSQRVVLRVVRTASPVLHTASRCLPRLLLARHDCRSAGVRPVPRTGGDPSWVHSPRVRAAVVRQSVCGRTRQLLLDGGGGRPRVIAVDSGSGTHLPGRCLHPSAHGAPATPPSFLLRSGWLRVARRSDRM